MIPADDDPAGPVDAGGDGWDETEVCDDDDPLTSPDAAELCDGDDNDDCDRSIDEDRLDCDDDDPFVVPGDGCWRPSVFSKRNVGSNQHATTPRRTGWPDPKLSPRCRPSAR